MLDLPNKPFISTSQLARAMDVCGQTIGRMRRDGRIPPPAHADSVVTLWAREDIIAWDEAGRPVAEAAGGGMGVKS